MNDIAERFSLDGQVALVTGAGRGIGAEIAQTLGAAGATVLGADISGINDINGYLEEGNIKGRGLSMDVSSPESIAEAQADIAKREGTVTILVNNAGITRDNLLMRMKVDEWEDLMRINLSSLYYVSKAFLRPMMKTQAGRIINIASVVGVMGNAGQSNYGAAKAGVIGFSKSLAKEVGARGITVNAVAPGFIQTQMTDALNEDQRGELTKQIPLQRLGTVNDVAGVVLFLASAAGAYVTGETIHVNGGMYMS
jgi:3-oxoacyl-[acyl-carrier protein] reductase